MKQLLILVVTSISLVACGEDKGPCGDSGILGSYPSGQEPTGKYREIYKSDCSFVSDLCGEKGTFKEIEKGVISLNITAVEKTTDLDGIFKCTQPLGVVTCSYKVNDDYLDMNCN